MFAFVQAFGLQTQGGGPRILRALLERAPARCLSICAAPYAPDEAALASLPPELHVPYRPHFGRVETTRFASLLGHFTPWFRRRFEDRLEDICRDNGAVALHSVAHGPEFLMAFDVAQRLGIPYFLSVHDDVGYLMKGRPEAKIVLKELGRVWNGAAGRTVISDEMGEECVRRYGHQPYVLITDGVTDIGDARTRNENDCRVYFAGILAFSYDPNFDALFRALGA